MSRRARRTGGGTAVVVVLVAAFVLPGVLTPAAGAPALLEARPAGLAVVAAAGGGIASASPAGRWPVDGDVIAPFIPPATPYAAGHRGVDLEASPGEAVRATLDGIVTFSGTVAGVGWVTIDHGGGLETTYGDLDPRAVRAGQHVVAGEPLGQLASGARHLDWGARRDGAYVDPLGLLARFEIRLVPTS